MNNAAKSWPKPLFDTMETIDEEINPTTSNYLTTLNIPHVEREYALTREFLRSYAGSLDTFNSYRREVERFLQWSWLIIKKPIKEIDRNDIRLFLEFIQNPPLHWISTKNASRFIDQEGLRIPNPAWRPFVVRVSKALYKEGKKPNKQEYQLTNKSIQALFAGLSTFFSFFQQETYLDINPIQLVRQKSRYIQKQQSQKITRRLSNLQWRYVIDTIEGLANNDSLYERYLFLISIFYLLGLRISEVADTPGRTPKMGDFAPDKHDRWWFTTVGKGNKVRDVAVPNAMLEALKRYRISRGLIALPSRGENTPLLHKERGRNGLGTRQVRNLIQLCFDKAIDHLYKAGKQDEAQDLAAATVHWLRHTSISADVEHRPREHVRDDAGHENAMITDRYIDTDRIARHESAKLKPLKPSIEE
ncbi:MAG: site-specific integrase [Gammaproteobacteria bacterium]|nr:site-specific integrase [Gammaproteobacteria bacterium]